jgi:hypothetical protein
MTEPSSKHPQVSAWLERIRYLTVEIGPRGSTREGERKGAEYAQSEFQKMGLKPVWESFQAVRSNFQPHMWGGILMLVAFVIYPLGGETSIVIAALLSILVLVTELQELAFQNNLYRLILPKAESQNVHAVIPPSGEHTGDLVIVGHLDSQRTPFIFRSPKHVKAYDNFVTLTFITFILQVVLYSLSVFLHWSWVWYATIPTAICAFLLALMCFEADTTPYTAGANDNASAAGMVLTLAEQFSKHPLQHTRVWAVCTGCEEVQHYGMIDFYRRHLADLKNPTALVFELIGCDGPAWLIIEGIVVPFKADPGLVETVIKLAKEHPEWGAYPGTISGGNTEMADAVKNKIPAITLFGMAPDGVYPYWHQKADTFDKMNPEVMERTWDFTNALIQEIDRRNM